MAKRTGKTHENLENELTPPLVARRPAATAEPPPRTRSSGGRQARSERSGPIGISGGDFATPSSRKRTTTQPRGVPVLGTTAARNGTPAPVPRADGAQPEAPFASPTSRDLGDAASQLAAEAAAARALDSGPLTPPPTIDDPGPTPPPVAASERARAPVAAEPEHVAATSLAEPSLVESSFVGPPSEPALESALSSPLELAIESSLTPVPEPDVEPPRAEPVAEAAAESPAMPDVDREAAEERFSALETPWPELAQQSAALHAPTPVPGAIPTDAMGGDTGGGIKELAPEAPRVTDAAEARRSDDGELAAVDELEVDDGAEALDALPAEALADGEPAPAVAAVPPAPPRAAAAPPPIPSGHPRRKTGEIRAPEVPTAQVVASIVPEISAGAAPLPEALAQRPRRPKRSKPWFEEVFDEDYLRTLPFMSADQTLREVEFVETSLGVAPGGQILDVGCGYGRHAIEPAQRGLEVTGLDLSLPLLIRAADEAQKRAMSVNFMHADMREMAFEKQFDGVYCMLTSFGYFDEDTNLRVAEGIARALKPGGRFLLDLVNRDYVVGDLPSRVWWEGNGCVVLEEVDFNFHTSRILTHRSIVFEDGRQVEQEISVRAYSLHEIGRLLRQAGFRVIDISGSLATRGHFFGGTSRNLLILAEKRTDDV